MSKRLSDFIDVPPQQPFRYVDSDNVEFKERGVFNEKEVEAARCMFDMANRTPYESAVEWEKYQMREAGYARMWDGFDDEDREAVMILHGMKDTERKRAEAKKERDFIPLPRRRQIEQVGVGVKVSYSREEALPQAPVMFTDPFHRLPPPFEVALPPLPVPFVPSQAPHHQQYYPSHAPNMVAGPSGMNQSANYNYHPDPAPNTSAYHSAQYYQGSKSIICSLK